MAFYVHYSLFNMKKIRANYRYNFGEFFDLRNIISEDEFNKLLRHKMCNALSEELFKDDSIKIDKTKERFDIIDYKIEFNYITNNELKDIIDLIKENKLELQPEFYYELINKLTKFE